MSKKIVCCLMMLLLVFGGVACNGSEKTGQNTELQDGWETLDLSKSQTENTGTLLGGKVLEGLTVVGEDDAYYCNLEENMRSEGRGEYQVLVCKDPVYDITYYVNYGRDYYIYAIRDGVTELAVELPGRELFCREGELYFIADTFGLYTFDAFEQGNILKYNPVNGSVEVVVDRTATGMIVYPDGICYKLVGKTTILNEESGLRETESERFYYSFATETVTAFPERVTMLRRWKNYHFRPELEALPEDDPVTQQMRAMGYTDTVLVSTATSLVDMEGKAEGTLKNTTFLSSYQWIGGDVSYDVTNKEDDFGQRRSILMSYHLETGEWNEVAVLDYPTTLSVDDMLLYKDTIYFGNKLRVSLEDGSQCYAQYENGGFGAIDAFYTDGERIFCLQNEKLWRLEEEKAMPVAAQEFVTGVPLEIGSYIYKLLEP